MVRKLLRILSGSQGINAHNNGLPNAARSPAPVVGVMHNSPMKIATYFLTLVAAITTVVIESKSMSQPITFTGFGFIVWAVSPYAYLALMAKLVSTSTAELIVLLLSFLVGSLGVWLIIDAFFIHLDAQSGLVYIFAPIWQWAFLALASAPLYFLHRVKNA